MSIPFRSPLSPPFSASFRIPPPSVTPPCRPFISNRAILSHRRLSRSMQARRFYLRHRNFSFLHIYYLTPTWSRILYVLCGRPRILYPSRRDTFLLKVKERIGKRSRLVRDPCTRAIVLFFTFIFFIIDIIFGFKCMLLRN